jgi:hypothetical protein
VTHRTIAEGYGSPEPGEKTLGQAVKWITILAFIGGMAVVVVRIYDLPPRVDKLEAKVSAVEVKSAIADERWETIQEQLKRIDRKLDRR